MRKGVICLIALLVLCCMGLFGCGSENAQPSGTPAQQNQPVNNQATEAPEQQNPTTVEVQNSNGLYSWTLADGTVLQTKTDIRRYLDGNVWRAAAMARDLGFGDWKETIDADHPQGFRRIVGDTIIRVLLEYKTLEYKGAAGGRHNIIFDVIFMHSDNNAEYRDSVYKDPRGYDYQRLNLYRYNVPDGRDIDFDLIVCFTYACEHYANGEVCVFDGVLPSFQKNMYALYE